MIESMDASVIRSSTSDRLLSHCWPLRLSQWILGASASGLALLACFLLVRRLAGGFQRPLPPVALIATAAILVGVGASLRLLWLRSAPPDAKGWAGHLRLGPTSLSVLTIGASLSLPGTSAAALATFWLILLAGEAVAYGAFRSRGRGAIPKRAPATDHPTDGEPDHGSPQVPSPRSGGHAGSRVAVADIEYLPESVTQQVTRSCDDAGRDSIHALLRGAFAPGQRSLSLHVAFCPPMEVVPQIDAEQLEGAAVIIKTPQVMPYGARIDLRLEHFSQRSESVLIRLHALAPRFDAK
jgi:hypothetical protein